MNLMRLDPVRELEDMSERLNRMFARPMARRENGKETLTVADWIPTVDIEEGDQDYHITAELPGLRKEDVKITLQEGVLTLQGERKARARRKRQALSSGGTLVWRLRAKLRTVGCGG
jgi:HSP20 family protein